MQGFKSRLGQLNTEKSQLNADLAESQSQIKALTTERDALRSKATDSVPADLAELETLRREKGQLEKALAEEKAAKVIENPEQASLIVSECPLSLSAIVYRTLPRSHCEKKEISCLQRRRVGSTVPVDPAMWPIPRQRKQNVFGKLRRRISRKLMKRLRLRQRSMFWLDLTFEVLTSINRLQRNKQEKHWRKLRTYAFPT